jgi:hypothetical protein
VTKAWFHNKLFDSIPIAPLVTFRIVFGSLMVASIFRFWTNGWIEQQFVEPSFHFKYFGFHWIPDPTSAVIYAIFLFMGIAAAMIILGLFYRYAAAAFFVLFTYVELIDATYYLNHYYFVSLVSFLMIFLPAGKQASLDVALGWVKPVNKVAAWTIGLLMFQLGVVYCLAGIAKLNYDWLVEAMPLAIWLPTQAHLPVLGPLMEWWASPHLFSWFGALYDLSIPFLLLWRPTRPFAYLAVIVFHMLTWWMFQIGMFPFIMIGATLIFFPSHYHERWHKAFRLPAWRPVSERFQWPSMVHRNRLVMVLGCYVLIQCLFPFRNLLYPGDPLWHEQGYRFGWRVMLVEKAGYAQFKVHAANGGEIWVDNDEFLTPVQEKMMATQSDFILQYAAHLKAHYEKEGVSVEQVSADVRVSYNGRGSQPYIDEHVDLASLEDGWSAKTWIKPLR